MEKRKKRVLECYGISIILYGNICWPISTGKAERCFYIRILKLAWTERVRNKEVLKKEHVQNQEKSLFREIMREERLKNVTDTRHMEGNR